MDSIGILILDDEAGSKALRQLLDSENWLVSAVSQPGQALQQLATGDWALVIANIGMTGLNGPLYTILRELALASPAEEPGKKRVRVLFMVPESAGAQAATLEAERLPYVLRPFNLHDFLERVSDLLMETEAIPKPIRRVRQEGKSAGGGLWGSHDNSTNRFANRNTGMFARREDYAMTEEEIAEYERQEAAETQRKKKKQLRSLD